MHKGRIVSAGSDSACKTGGKAISLFCIIQTVNSGRIIFHLQLHPIHTKPEHARGSFLNTSWPSGAQCRNADPRLF